MSLSDVCLVLNIYHYTG